MLVVIDGITAELTRKDIRTLRLTVRPDGCVRISAPRFLSDNRIAAFVHDKRTWIEAQQAKAAAHTTAEPQYVTGESFVYLGRCYTLELREGNADFLFLDETASRAVLTLRDLGHAEERGLFLREWRRAALREEIAQRLSAWETKTGLHPTGFSLRDMHTRWGSCNTQTGKLWFSLMLSEQPPDCLDYVILHELCHLRIPNHGANFKALMDTHMPDWREWKKRLNT